MGYKLTLPDGLIVEMDSMAEFAEAVKVLRGQTAPAPQVELQVGQQVEPAPVDAAMLRRFLRGMPEKQRSVLTCLYASPGSVVDEQIWAALGIDGNSELGGTMGAISKRANRVGMSINDAFLKDSTQRQGVRHYTYTMTEGMRAVMPN